MYAGIDAGGTKTEICFCDSSGHVVSRSVSQGVNAARTGAAAAARHIAEEIKTIAPAGAFRLYAGIAGAGSKAISAEIHALLTSMLPEASAIAVASDAFNGLNSEVGTGDGIALIAGTGSSAFVRRGGSITQVGGRGYLIDDAGSGYWVGRECLNAAFRAKDGRGNNTLLVHAAERQLGCAIEDSIPVIYECGTSFVASFAPIVFECAGDPVADAIAESCARELWRHVEACTHHYGGMSPVCVATGGMFKAAFLRNRLTEYASEAGIRMVFPTVPPVAGAVIAAAAENADAEFIKNLKDDLNGLR